MNNFPEDRVIFFNLLKEKNLLFPFYMILLIFSSRYLANNELYIFIDGDRVKDMTGPGLVTNLSIYKYHKIDINLIAPDLVNEKYDYKYRIKEQIGNETLNFKI